MTKPWAQGETEQVENKFKQGRKKREKEEGKAMAIKKYTFQSPQTHFVLPTKRQNNTTTQQHCNTVHNNYKKETDHSNTAIQQHRNTVTQQHSHAATQQQWNTARRNKARQHHSNTAAKEN